MCPAEVDGWNKGSNICDILCRRCVNCGTSSCIGEALDRRTIAPAEQRVRSRDVAIQSGIVANVSFLPFSVSLSLFLSLGFTLMPLMKFRRVSMQRRDASPVETGLIGCRRTLPTDLGNRRPDRDRP